MNVIYFFISWFPNPFILQVHKALSEEEKMKICCALNYEKISPDVCKHLAQNPKFPSRAAIQALLSQQSKLKSLLQDTDSVKSSNALSCTNGDEANAKINDEQIVLHAKRLDLATENEVIKEHLQGMQWRVMELEKVCQKLQTQMGKIMKAKKATPGTPKSLPKLCS